MEKISTFAEDLASTGNKKNVSRRTEQENRHFRRRYKPISGKGYTIPKRRKNVIIFKNSKRVCFLANGPIPSD